MADTKTSALPSMATAPLSSDLLMIVSSGANKKITAGRFIKEMFGVILVQGLTSQELDSEPEQVIIRGGDGHVTSGPGGQLFILGGNAASVGALGGKLTLKGGSGNGANGGDVVIEGGDGSGAEPGRIKLGNSGSSKIGFFGSNGRSQDLIEDANNEAEAVTQLNLLLAYLRELGIVGE